MPGSTVIELLVFGLGEEIVRLSCFIESHVSRGQGGCSKTIHKLAALKHKLGTPVLFQGMHDQIFSEGMVFKQKILCLHLLVDIRTCQDKNLPGSALGMICTGRSRKESEGVGRRVAQFSDVFSGRTQYLS